MLDFYTFQYLESLDGVDSVDSEYEQSPLNDPDLTLFFKNGYRLISKKCTLGQTLELEPVDDDLLDLAVAPSYKAEIYHNVIKGCKTEDKFVEMRNDNETAIDIETFAQEVTDIVGKEVKDFLKDRHQSIPFRTIQNRYK